MIFFSQILFFLSLFLLSTPLFSLDLSFGTSVGATAYNNNFFLENKEGKSTKELPAHLFAPVFNLNLSTHFSQWRLGIEGSYRPEISFETKQETLFKNTEVKMNSGIRTLSISFELLYEVPISLKDHGFFGISLGYGNLLVKPWHVHLELKGKNYEQVLKEREVHSFVFKMIAGRSFEILDNFFLDLTFSFSPIEWLRTGLEPLKDEIPRNKLGDWALDPPYQFPLRPLDFTLGLRKRFNL